MAHYALIDGNNIVVNVITGLDESELIEGVTPEEWYGNFHNMKCVRTSYNGNIRKRYASIGFVYDETQDAFIPQQPYPSWVFNEETLDWDPPIARPDSGPWVWDESSVSWIGVKTDGGN